MTMIKQIVREKYLSIVVALLILPVYFVHGQDCAKLSDGKYKIKFSKQYGGSTYVLLLDCDHFTKIGKGQEIKGDVKINDDCILQLDHHIKWDTTIVVQRVLSKSTQPYFKFHSTTGSTLKFRMTGYGGPHVTSGEGKFIRID